MKALLLVLSCFAMAGCSSFHSPRPTLPQADLEDHQYRLGECVGKAAAIVEGEVVSKIDGKDGSLITVRRRGTLKGQIADRQIVIHSAVHIPEFKERFIAAPVQPIEIRHLYIFFLSASTPTNGVFTLFNAFDGVVPYSRPVAWEVAFLVTGRGEPQVLRDLRGVNYGRPELPSNLPDEMIKGKHAE